jgi:hypothetical protein
VAGSFLFIPFLDFVKLEIYFIIIIILSLIFWGLETCNLLWQKPWVYLGFLPSKYQTFLAKKIIFYLCGGGSIFFVKQ